MSKRLAVLALALFLALGRAAAGEKFTVGGYLKSFFMVFRFPEPEDSGTAPRQALLGISSTRLRLKLSFSPSDRLSFQAAYDISPRIQDPLFFRSSPFGYALDPGGYRAADFRNPLFPGRDDPVGSFGLYHNLDRLSVTVRSGIGDLIIGRQPMAWGSGRVVSPTDVIAPFSFNELDKEERYGVDGVRLRVPLGTLSELDIGYVFGKKFKFSQSAFFLKSRFSILKTDLTFIFLGFRRDLLLGIDLARSVGGAGVWLEGAFVVPDAFDRSRPQGNKDYVRLSAGLDGSLSGQTYAFLEYHFNSAGAAQPESYTNLLSQPAYTRGSAYLLGKHYLFAGLNYQLTPLVPLTGMAVYNASDGSWSLSPQAEYNISENIYLAGGAYFGIGKRPAASLFAGPAVRPELASEFGSYPDFAYLSFRFYF